MLIKDRPLASRVLLIGVFATFGFAWLAVVAGYAYATNVLEAVFFLSACLAMLGGYRGSKYFAQAVFAFTYIVLCGAFAIFFNNVNALDYFQASKCFFYVFLLMPFAEKNYFNGRDIKRLNSFFLVLFASVYTIKRFLLAEPRPIVLAENNFELILVSLVFYGAYLVDAKVRIHQLVLFGYIVALSSSRSSAVVAIVVLLSCVEFKKIRRRDLLVLVGIVVSAIVAFFIFESRSTKGLEGIDRYKFFQEFLYATRKWGVFDFLVGAPRMTALPREVCAHLSYYAQLFSYAGDGRCYSVVFHSFDMRAVFDHGLLGLGYLIYCVRLILVGIGDRGRRCVIAVLVLTGMSVSSLNNVYVAISLAILASTRFDRLRQEQPQHRPSLSGWGRDAGPLVSSARVKFSGAR